MNKKSKNQLSVKNLAFQTMLNSVDKSEVFFQDYLTKIQNTDLEVLED